MSFSENVPGSRLDGELREVGARTKASFQLCRLPVRPRVRSGPADTGPVAKSTRKNITTTSPSDVFGKGVHVLDRLIDRHTKAGSPRQTAHEAHSMASQKQLEDSGIPRKGYSSTQVFTSPFTMLKEDSVLTGQPLHPIQHALQIFTDTSKEGWGAHLNEFTARGNWHCHCVPYYEES